MDVSVAKHQRARDPRWSSRSHSRKGVVKGLDWKEENSSKKQLTRGRLASPEKPLFWSAVERCDVERVRGLLGIANIEEKYKSWSPLMKAAEENQIEIMQMLIACRADLDVANNKGRTALSFAADPSMKRPTAIGTLKLLLEARADTTRKDATGLTPKARCKRNARERKDALDVFEIAGQ